MVIARRFLIREDEVGLFHVIGRCVRRSWLCGKDPLTGNDYEHRKQWIKSRLQFISKYFHVEVCGYSVLSSHYHCMLRSRPDRARNLSSEEVAKKWWYLFPKRRDLLGNPEEPKDEELDQILLDPESGDHLGRLELLRKRLCSISWFMRCLNEYIARKANREDACTGRFWEGRFKSIELLDQAAVLACLAYIDLNPIHAGMASTPESSDFTSGQERIRSQISKEKIEKLREEFNLKNQKSKTKRTTDHKDKLMNELRVTIEQSAWLSPISEWPLDRPRKGYSSFLNIDLKDYLELLDWTGRQHREDKKGEIPSNLEPLLKRMEIEIETWLITVKQFDNWFHRVAGRVERFVYAAQKKGKKWLAGKKAAKTAFT